MTIFTIRHALLMLLVVSTAGCDLLREQGKSSSPASEPERPLEETATTEPFVPSIKPPPPPAPKPTTTKKDDPPAVAPVETRTVEGTVRAVDPQRRLISVTVRGQSQTFSVDPKAPVENLADASHVLKGGLAAIRPGNGVFLVTYRNKSDKEVVSLIRVKATTK
jgi:hypothetical protein